MLSETVNLAQAAYDESYRRSTVRQCAWAALVLSVVSLQLGVFVVPPLAAITCGAVALRRSRTDSERSFRVMALIGILLSAAVLVLLLGMQVIFSRV